MYKRGNPTPLPRPTPEAARHLIALPIDLNSGQRFDGYSRDERYDFRSGRGANRAVPGGFMEYFRLDASGRLVDTQDRLASRGMIGGGEFPFGSFQSWFGRPDGPSGFGFSRGNPNGPYFGGRDAEDGYRAPPSGTFSGAGPPQRRLIPGDRPGF